MECVPTKFGLPDVWLGINSMASEAMRPWAVFVSIQNDTMGFKNWTDKEGIKVLSMSCGYECGCRES